MTYTYEQGVTWIRTLKQTVRTNWNGYCEALMWWALGGSTPSYDTATIARNRSNLVSADINAAPPGAFHWWDIDDVPAGHVAVAAGGGMSIMASSVASRYGEDWGNNVALIGVEHYGIVMGGRAHYKGWSYDHAGAHFANAAPPAPPAPTINPLIKRRRQMSMPFIIQQGVLGSPQYGVNIAVFAEGTFEIVGKSQRDVWLDLGVAFQDCTIPGRFEYHMASIAAHRARTSASTAKDVEAALQNLIDSAKTDGLALTAKQITDERLALTT